MLVTCSIENNKVLSFRASINRISDYVQPIRWRDVDGKTIFRLAITSDDAKTTEKILQFLQNNDAKIISTSSIGPHPLRYRLFNFLKKLSPSITKTSSVFARRPKTQKEIINEEKIIEKHIPNESDPISLLLDLLKKSEEKADESQKMIVTILNKLEKAEKTSKIELVIGVFASAIAGYLLATFLPILT